MVEKMVLIGPVHRVNSVQYSMDGFCIAGHERSVLVLVVVVVVNAVFAVVVAAAAVVVTSAAVE